ncbi:MAG: helix-turn-helix domain-containing protein [Lachnospiraceae bacterium]
MYMNYANPSGRPEGILDKSKPILVTSCGNYKLKDTEKNLPVTRPKGRIDYQIIYIASGKAHFNFDKSDKDTILPAGKMVIYQPKEYQKYAFYGKENADIYWIHFTGSNAKSILKDYGLINPTHVISAGFHPDYIALFRKIILEMQMERSGSSTMTSLLIQQLFLEVYRQQETTGIRHRIIPAEVEAAIEYFHKNYYQPLVMDEYAKKHNMSISTLSRMFKQHTGLTPLQYVLNIRLSTAKNLLKDTDLTINEISNMVGYDNPLYFSRLFHKHVGMAPRDYRG